MLCMKNNKPPWDVAPKWAQYLILDESGAWAFCEHEPEKMGLSVSPDAFMWLIRTGKVKYVTKSTKIWHRLQIEKRPK